MSDWTLAAPYVRQRHYSQYWLGGVGSTIGTLGTVASTAYPAAGRVFLIPFRIVVPVRVTSMFVHNGATVSGNVDLGIYSKDGVRLASTGSFAQSGTSTLQTVSLTTPITLWNDQFFMAVTVDNTTATVFRSPLSLMNCRVVGVYQHSADTFPLPSTVTLTTLADQGLFHIGILVEGG